MNRATLFDGLAERYGAAAEYPWAKSPDFAVFRHTGNPQMVLFVYARAV